MKKRDQIKMYKRIQFENAKLIQQEISRLEKGAQILNDRVHVRTTAAQ